MKPPETRYAKAANLRIAYQVFGEGPGAIVFVSGILHHLETIRSAQEFSLYRRLARFSRVVLFDRRGAGQSDRPAQESTIDERSQDVLAVMDDIGLERATVLGSADGGPVAITFAAAHPDRTEALVISSSWARFAHAPDYPQGYSEAAQAAWLDVVSDRWGSEAKPLFLGRLVRRLADDAEWRRALARMERLAASPGAAVAHFQAMYKVDVRPLLAAVRAPTLVLHATGDGVVPIQHGRYIAENIPGARLVELEGTDHLLTDKSELIAGIIQEFLTGQRPEPEVDRRVVTILFTDIVGSTGRAVAMGDRRWAELLEKHDEHVCAEIHQHGGHLVRSTGDGVFAEFSAPRKAIECAAALRQMVRSMALEIRAGIHTGEVEVRPGQGPQGIAVHLAARIAAAAQAGEILTSRTVKDLVTGSELVFSDRGIHTLKGVTDEWQLFAVEA